MESAHVEIPISNLLLLTASPKDGHLRRSWEEGTFVDLLYEKWEYIFLERSMSLEKYSYWYLFSMTHGYIVIFKSEKGLIRVSYQRVHHRPLA